jgi:cytochrome c553
MRWKVIAAITFLIPQLAQGAQAQTRAQAEATRLRESSCQTCHGETGDSPNQTVPRLNGQHGEYLLSRLQSFRNPLREAPRMVHEMGHLSSQLGNEVAAALAKFYAGQTPPTPDGNANRVGAALYRNGAKDIPACRGCHGEQAEGRGAAARLAGQHKAYLRLQLQAFGMAARIADPMNHHVWMMTPEQVEAMAAYLGK